MIDDDENFLGSFLQFEFESELLQGRELADMS